MVTRGYSGEAAVERSFKGSREMEKKRRKVERRGNLI